MRSIKTFGLAAFAVLAAMALIGASLAMATSTRLCTTHVEPCGTGVTKSIFHLKANEIWLLHELKPDGFERNVLCLSVLSEVEYGSLGAPQSVTMLSLEFGSCGTEGSGGSHSNCEVKALHIGLGETWTATLLKTALNLGEFEVTDAEALLRVKCVVFGFIILECEYEVTGSGFHVDGAAAGNNGLLLPEGIILPVASGTCEEEDLAEITLGTLEPLTAGYVVG